MYILYVYRFLINILYIIEIQQQLTDMIITHENTLSCFSKNLNKKLKERFFHTRI